MHRFSETSLEQVSKIHNISPEDYLYWTKYVLRKNVTAMLTFKCKSANCFIYMLHNGSEVGESTVLGSFSFCIEPGLREDQLLGSLAAIGPDNQTNLGIEGSTVEWVETGTAWQVLTVNRLSTLRQPNAECVAACQKQCEPFKDTWYNNRFLPMLLFATIIFGLIANLIVIFLTNNFKLKTVVDQYVRNLAVAGILGSRLLSPPLQMLFSC